MSLIHRSMFRRYNYIDLHQLKLPSQFSHTIPQLLDPYIKSAFAKPVWLATFASSKRLTLRYVINRKLLLEQRITPWNEVISQRFSLELLRYTD